MIAFNGSITFDILIMLAAFIYVVVRAIEYVTIKKTNNVPRWLVLGSFGIAVLTAICMTYWIISILRIYKALLNLNAVFI